MRLRVPRFQLINRMFKPPTTHEFLCHALWYGPVQTILHTRLKHSRLPVNWHKSVRSKPKSDSGLGPGAGSGGGPPGAAANPIHYRGACDTHARDVMQPGQCNGRVQPRTAERTRGHKAVHSSPRMPSTKSWRLTSRHPWPTLARPIPL